MDVAGLVVGVYKDVYFLAKSVYRLASSAQHYQAEQNDTLHDLWRELLLLGQFYHVIFTLRGKELARDGQNTVRSDDAISYNFNAR